MKSSSRIRKFVFSVVAGSAILLNAQAASGASLGSVNEPALAQAAQLQQSQPGDAQLLRQLGNTPTAKWLGGWTKNVRTEVDGVLDHAARSGDVPVFVAYNIPGRDCGQYSAGGLSPAEYRTWIRDLAAGIENRRAMVIVEPDALAQLCGDTSTRYSLLRDAVQVLSKNSEASVYLDAGHSNWIAADEMAKRLQQAGVAGARGFSLNVSNFQTTASEKAYGNKLTSLIPGAHFVIDTSRNGNGPPANGSWCNPSGRVVGERPAFRHEGALDAFVWVKTPGESDGNCNGGPAAGEFSVGYALSLVKLSR